MNTGKCSRKWKKPRSTGRIRDTEMPSSENLAHSFIYDCPYARSTTSEQSIDQRASATLFHFLKE